MDDNVSNRKAISASTRWSIFFRDGFACRYCGSQAGQQGVELVIDHVLSVADGGDNSFDNLIAACRRCNDGKGAKSLLGVPTSKEVSERIRLQRQSIKKLKKQVTGTIKARLELEQQVVNIKCTAYDAQIIETIKSEISTAIGLLREFGPDRLFEWYASASSHGVKARKAILYVCGCARKTRERNGKV